MLDSRLLVATPEGVDLELIPAGPLVRSLAYIIDLLIRGVMMLVVGVALAALGDFGAGILLIVYFLLEWLYPVMFEAVRGATPGKRIMGLQVITCDGLPVGWAAASLRNLLRVVDFLPVAYAVGQVAMVVSGRFQRLGDLAANTLVVYTTEVPAASTAAAGEALSLPFTPNRQERQAILDFAVRSAVLSVDRQRELACSLAGPLDEADPERCRQRLLAGARYLTGVERS
jgi:uncharacterized RDD family membrane protein YckC